MKRFKGNAEPEGPGRRTEMVLDALERALTSEEETDELIAHFQSDCAGQDDTDTLPVHLRDPFAVIERGNFLLANGIPSKRPTVETDTYDEELRMAARNGRAIPESVRMVMDADRHAARRLEEQNLSISVSEQCAGKPVSEGASQRGAQTSVDSVTRKQEIEELAELVGDEYAREGRIDPPQIAEAEGLSYSFGLYDECFDGLLECYKGQFHIFINLVTNKSRESPRARFSFAHELGHYFLDWHRRSLEGGAPAHGSFADFQSNNLVEREADQFAANLLLPSKRVKKAARGRIDAEEIVRLANVFGTSISATAMRCARLNLAPLIVMRWTQQGRAWCWSSDEYEERTRNRAFRSIERIPPDSVTRQVLNSGQADGSVASRGTTLATWFPNVRMGSSGDDILVEECIPLGAYGAITVLRPA